MRVRTTLFAALALAFASTACQPPAQEAGTVVVDGTELKWEIAGEGMPCMVIGNPIAYQRILSDTFKKNLRCVYGDSRIFAPGPSPADAPQEYTFEMAVADAEKVRQAAGFERVVVVGHSVHSLMALEYAKAYPDHVSHVVMITMGPSYGGSEWQRLADQYWDSLASVERKAALTRNQAMLTEDSLANVRPNRVPVVQYLASTPQRWYDFNYDAAWIFEGIEYNNRQWLDYLFGEVTPGYDVSAGLEGVRVPVFLALGAHDYLVPPSMWDPVRPKFPNLTLVIFDESGHFPMLEERELFDEKLIAWVTEN